MTAAAKFLLALPIAIARDAWHALLDSLDARLCAIANATHEPLDHESDD